MNADMMFIGECIWELVLLEGRDLLEEGVLLEEEVLVKEQALLENYAHLALDECIL